MSLLERARAFLDRVPLVDGHNDLPFVIRADKGARLRLYDPTTQRASPALVVR